MWADLAFFLFLLLMVMFLAILELTAEVRYWRQQTIRYRDMWDNATWKKGGQGIDVGPEATTRINRH